MDACPREQPSVFLPLFFRDRLKTLIILFSLLSLLNEYFLFKSLHQSYELIKVKLFLCPLFTHKAELLKYFIDLLLISIETSHDRLKISHVNKSRASFIKHIKYTPKACNFFFTVNYIDFIIIITSVFLLLSSNSDLKVLRVFSL